MATLNQLKALMRAHFEKRHKDFETIACQVAAHEKKLGHDKAADAIHRIINKAKDKPKAANLPPLGALDGVLEASFTTTTLESMFIETSLRHKLDRVLEEQRCRDKLHSLGLTPKRKLLLIGPPGTGKTMTASMLAAETELPLYRIHLDGLITSFMGETAARLRQVFNFIKGNEGVYFFDEFDALGTDRSIGRDLGESRRILNSLLTMIEQDRSDNLIVFATNHPALLDNALYRRFDDLLIYDLPSESAIVDLLKSQLKGKVDSDIDWHCLAKSAKSLSQSEILSATNEVLKNIALSKGTDKASESEILSTIQDRLALNMLGKYK